jgi:hypothetical protein
MNLSIQKIRPAKSEEWDDIWGKCPYATYFQSREWAEIWERYSDGKIKPEPILLHFSDENRVVLPFSLKQYFGGLFTLYFTSLPGVKWGGWISVEFKPAR